jgi:DNA gyrase/topoisomerase IV subunit B
MSQTLENKYRKLDDIEHALLRPGMYIGSTTFHKSEEFVIKDGKFVKERLEYIPGFLKIFDEIVSNSIDESKRNLNLNEISVHIDVNKSTIVINDNGGIPVAKHKEHDEWIPEMIFSNLKAGSNFNDDEQRLVAGTNGVGSTLTNIFSKEFIVKTADGKHSFEQTFSNNMRNRTTPKIELTKDRYTEITYQPDLKQFGIDSISEDHLKLIYRRCHELSACNSNIKIKWSVKRKRTDRETIKYSSFRKYIECFVDDYFYEESDHWKIGIAHSKDSFEQVSYVNSVYTRQGGSHVDHILSQIVNQARTFINKKYKTDVRPGQLKNHFFLFVSCDIVNSQFDAQTKEKLITEPKDFGSSHDIDKRTINKILKSEILQSILDWIDKKAAADERSKLRNLNKNLDGKKVLRLIDAKSKGDRENCVLGIYEGQSALSAVRKFRDSQTTGAFPLKGKFLNVNELKSTQIVKNEEVKDLMASIGLRLGEKPNTLRYGKILIYTDADPDGDAICALLVNFFFKYWPELFEQGKIYRVMTPIIVATKNRESIKFYSQSDYAEWKESINTSVWKIAYKKGLAALTDPEYREIIENPKLVQLTSDETSLIELNAWFGGNSEPRKVRLLKT